MGSTAAWGQKGLREKALQTRKGGVPAGTQTWEKPHGGPEGRPGEPQLPNKSLLCGDVGEKVSVHWWRTPELPVSTVTERAPPELGLPVIKQEAPSGPPRNA